MTNIEKTIIYVKKELQQAEAGHDWFHIQRVYGLAIKIAETEICQLKVVQYAALLHDIADSKFHGDDETIGPRKAREFLATIAEDPTVVDHVVKIIENISFKGGHFNQTFKSIELDIVQDADRLDALGAIGIARAFNYGGYKNRSLFDPDILPNLGMDRETYKKSDGPTINHFYEKLLLLKDRMNTSRGKALAQVRHDYMLDFLSHFKNEWFQKI